MRSDDGLSLSLAGQWSDAGPRHRDFPGLDGRGEFIEFLERRQWIVDLDEHRRSPEVYQNLRLPDALEASHDLRIFLPLMHRGRLVGLMGLERPTCRSK